MKIEDIIKELERARWNPGRLEELFRMMQKNEERLFMKAIENCATRFPDDLLFHAWKLRLEVRREGGFIIEEWRPSNHVWIAAIGLSIALGLVYLLLANGNPPLPFAVESGSLFWWGWPGLLGVALLLFLAVTSPRMVIPRRMVVAIAAIALMSATAGVQAFTRTDHVALLASLHLPFVVWAIVGAAYMGEMRRRTQQVFVYVKKSIAVCTVAGIFYLTGGLFSMLTMGIFRALGVEIPEGVILRFAAWGIGMVPLLALASVYDPLREPIEQDQGRGVDAILSSIARLFLPPVVGVLIIYVVWFIPNNFWGPFNDRHVLSIYNATIIAVIALLVFVPGASRERGALQRWLWRGMVVTVILTMLLNLYACAAVLTRTLQGGITPNRHAVLGWNVTTFIMLGFLLIALMRPGRDDWIGRFGESFSKAMIFPVGWSVWVLFITPLLGS